MNTYNFIAIEGPIGIGKSTLSKLIAERYNYHLLKEIVEENPFLTKFYDNLDEWAFQTEMFFLANRFKQLEDIEKMHLQQNQSVVADYHVFKNHIFSKRTLNKEQYGKYAQIFDILMDNKPQPNILIYLNANIDTILSRIDKRGRNMEKNIDVDYLKQLSTDYDLFINDFEKRNPHIPIIRINVEEVDFLYNPHDLDNLFYQLNKLLV